MNYYKNESNRNLYKILFLVMVVIVGFFSEIVNAQFNMAGGIV